MKKIFGISILVLIWLFSISAVNAQEKGEQSRTIQKELKVSIDDESGEPSYTVETTTTENGEKKVVKKTYSSLEEMKEDSSIDVIRKSDENGNITMKLGDKGSNVMVFTSDDGDTNQITKTYKVKVIKDEDHEGHQIHEHENVFVIKDDEGNISVSHGGEEDVMVWVDESDQKKIKRTYHVKAEKSSFAEASIQPIAAGEEEFSSFNLSVMPELVLKSINYYPNPNQGEFTLAFTGSRKPVIVRILDLNGNMKMEENIKDFDGTFNQVLNVKHFEKGTYLLQIFQQEKVLNRKLILE